MRFVPLAPDAYPVESGPIVTTAASSPAPGVATSLRRTGSIPRSPSAARRATNVRARFGCTSSDHPTRRRSSSAVPRRDLRRHRRFDRNHRLTPRGSAELTEERGNAMYVPEGFAHGFQTLTDDAEVLYMISKLAPDAADGVAGTIVRSGSNGPRPRSERQRAPPRLARLQGPARSGDVVECPSIRASSRPAGDAISGRRARPSGSRRSFATAPGDRRASG